MKPFLISLGLIKDQLNPFETQCVQKVAEQLKPEATRIVLEQLKAVTLVQRHSQGKEVNLYRSKNWDRLGSASRFQREIQEEILATVTLGIAGKRRKLRLDLWLVRGAIFSLQYSSPPNKFFDSQDLASANPIIDEIKIRFDPLENGRVPRAPYDEAALPDWVTAVDQGRTIKSVKAPRDQSTVARLLSLLDTQLPQQYLDLVAATDGCEIPPWKIFGVNEIRSISLDQGSYYLLAEAQDEPEPSFIAVKQGSSDGAIYRLTHESDGREAPSSESFAQTVLSDSL